MVNGERQSSTNKATCTHMIGDPDSREFKLIIEFAAFDTDPQSKDKHLQRRKAMPSKSCFRTPCKLAITGGLGKATAVVSHGDTLKHILDCCVQMRGCGEARSLMQTGQTKKNTFHFEGQFQHVVSGHNP